jgi:hypothetical protein
MAMKSNVFLAAVIVLAACAVAFLILRRPDPRVEVAAAFARYQAAIADGDAAGALAVSSADSVAYFGGYLREHALRRTREEMEPRSIWEQYCILVYRDALGAEFLRTATPQEVYAELVRQHLLMFEVRGLVLGPIAIDKNSAEAPLIREGKPTGTSILFENVGGRWIVESHSNVRYALAGLHDVQAQGQLTKREFIGQLFERFCGKPLPDSLWDPPGP